MITRPSGADYGGRVLHIPDGPCVFTTSQLKLLPTDDGNHPRTSAWDLEVPKKESAIMSLHRRQQGNQEKIITEVEQFFLSLIKG